MKSILNNSQLPWVKNGENVIYLTLHGSRAYGIHRDDSDYDYKGVAIPPIEYVLGFTQKFEQNEISIPYDTVVYDLKKFMKLASECNPNIIEVLFVDDDDLLKIDKFGKKLRDNRYLFLSRKAKYSFGGYAHAQLKRAKSHRDYILNSQKYNKKPKRSDFGLPEEKKMLDGSSIGAINNLIKQGYEFSDDVVTLIQKEKEYKNALQKYHQYINWTKTRNPKRYKEELASGFDRKNAVHLVRLLCMCEEILKNGEVVVKRPNKKELINIRSGKWSYNDILKWANEKEKEIDELEKKSSLPKKPPINKINKLCMEILSEFYGVKI